VPEEEKSLRMSCGIVLVGWAATPDGKRRRGEEGTLLSLAFANASFSPSPPPPSFLPS